MKHGFTGTADILSASALPERSGADGTSAVPVKSCSLVISQALHRQLMAEAAAAYPNECCGLIEGARTGDTIEVVTLHHARNLASTPDRFEIDPAEHFRLLRCLRGTGRAIIGCYHSHPGGRAMPSPRDRKMASEENFVWLIAAVNERALCEVAAYLFADGEFAPLREVS